MTPEQRSILKVCRAYEYIYDAHFTENAPFPDKNRPEPSELAHVLQNLCRAVNLAVLTTPADSVREALSQVLSFIRCAHLDMGGNHRYTLRSSPEFPAVMQRASDLLAAPHDPEASARLAALPAAPVKEKT